MVVASSPVGRSDNKTKIVHKTYILKMYFDPFSRGQMVNFSISISMA